MNCWKFGALSEIIVCKVGYTKQNTGRETDCFYHSERKGDPAQVLRSWAEVAGCGMRNLVRGDRHHLGSNVIFKVAKTNTSQSLAEQL